MSVVTEILARNPLSFWRLSESDDPYVDEIAAVNGTETVFVGGITESQPSIVPGTAETSILFPHHDNIIFSDAYDFTGSTTFTAYCWVKAIAYDSANGHHLWINKDSPGRGWSLELVNPAVTWRMKRGDNAGFDQVDYTVTEAEYEDGTPRQVAMTYDGTNLVLNINGVNVMSGASSKSVVAPTTNTSLGFGGGDGGSTFDGWAQYLAIFSPNLVAADLLAIYRATVPTIAWLRV